MLFALRVAYVVILYYFLVFASILVDGQSAYKGLAFTIFAFGIVGTTYQLIFHVVRLGEKRILSGFFWALLAPLILPFIRGLLTNTHVSILDHTVETAVYLLLPTVPFLFEWIVTETKKDVRITMLIMSLFSSIQLVWFIIFLLAEGHWPQSLTWQSGLFYALILGFWLHSWLPVLQARSKNPSRSVQ